MSKIQLKPYLNTRRFGTTLRIGHMPPRGIEIEDAPAELDHAVDLLSRPTTRSEASRTLRDLTNIRIEDCVALIDQLIDAGVVGEVIPDDDRYARHLLYYDLLGAEPLEAQRQLKDATVAVVGTGGIGSNVATLLVAAGVGHIIITDGDTVELTNLTRQFLYDESSVGQFKVDAATVRLSAINSEVRVTSFNTAATETLFLERLAGCDVVIVSADSPDEIHEWLDNGARLHGYAYLAAGYIESFGTVGPLVLPGSTACYSCMGSQHELDSEELGPDLNRGLQAASYGALNLLVAAIAANETIRLITGERCETADRRLLIDSRNYSMTSEDFVKSSACAACGTLPPHCRGDSAMRHETLESVYADARSEASINAVVLDEFLHDLARVKTGDKILDFGCGTGDQAFLAAAAGAMVTAYDPSVEMMSTLRSRIETRGDSAQIHTVCSEAQAATLGPFDLVMCTNVLDHIDPADIRAVVQWLKDQIAPGGRAIITVPHPIKDGGVWIRDIEGDMWVYREMRLHEYFEEGQIVKHREDMHGDLALRAVKTYHRTIETYTNLFISIGLTISGIYEPRPEPESSSEFPIIWAKTSKVPYFLTFELRSSN
ncbi:TOMM precursor leader peptide-binding protein [Mycobacteroides abscessus]|uniref:TOMM precursor leader peptide-binding protein n=1 Tax=Mycobacteroides abscessus TaxID=36809 RepID=UPI0009A79D46|nr:TOMM precursor leader peptide-binding protein [Mycobacteroides abscessus]SKG08172.1 molybdenum cofactor biosynthesis protein B [Mycobacteroides abscessus subsp. massiliense]SKG91084.1 molybdenum cofactor biosynthesis protein B [Mycobacteroides abscessus subsp. massiliense]SKI00408.1 molybdenum cofactor biosynthesis protein B [Mycobacteroides abscessus subsp. massiliense]SKI96416.1 molybdenum cofactor biosynthesis protein B [Mycobacteroides abscessus subsp. massiliense]SKJ12389.1 molybdenum 